MKRSCYCATAAAMCTVSESGKAAKWRSEVPRFGLMSSVGQRNMGNVRRFVN